MTQTPDASLHVRFQEQIEYPKRYRVLLMNDDFTPMDFVVTVLMQFFTMNEEKAVQVMLDVHNKGQGECGVYTKDIAETKMRQANNYAREHKHPLLCQIEQCTI